MNNSIKLLEVVALNANFPDRNLWRGQVGTVVEILADGQAYEVEFCDRKGRTYESMGLRSDQLLPLRFEPSKTAKATRNSRKLHTAASSFSKRTAGIAVPLS